MKKTIQTVQKKYGLGDHYEGFSRLKILEDNKNAGALGAKVGDLFVIIDSDGDSDLVEGQVVEFVRDDRSSCPTFRLGDQTTSYINFCQLAKLPTGPLPKSNGNYRYEVFHKRSDGILFEKNAIDKIPVEKLQEQIQKHYAEARRIQGLLNAHSKLTF